MAVSGQWVGMKAVALLSGGLDSILASRIIKDLGVGLIAFNTVSPFCLCTHQQGCIFRIFRNSKISKARVRVKYKPLY